MVPIYAVNSWLSLRFKDSALYLDLVRDVYESYVIYLFFALMVAYIGDGDDEVVIKKMEGLPPMKQPLPFGLFFDPLEMDRSFLKKCKLGTLQFVVSTVINSYLCLAL